MDFGFIQAAAPASPPVPLTDAPAMPDALRDAAAAFDAAIAQTLAGGSSPAGKAPAGPNATRAQQPQWLLATLFADSITGSAGPAGAAVTSEEPVSEGDGIESEATAVEGATETPADVVVVPVPAPAPVPVPVPVPADAPALAAVPMAVVRRGDGTTENAASTETSAATLPALEPAVPASGEDGSPSAAPRTAAPSALAGQDARAEAHATNPVAAASPQAVDLPVVRAALGGTVAMAGDPTKAPAQEAAAVPSIPVPRATAAARAAHVPVTAPANIASAAPTATRAATEPTESPINAAAVAAAVAATPVAHAAGAESVGTLPAFESSMVSNAAASSFGPGQDAPMTGHDQSNGQGRPSHEFMRFAAALKQVAPDADAGGRAPEASVSAAPAAAPAAAAAPTVAIAAATSGATGDTPGPDNVGRLVQAMRVIARPGAWEANVRLNPEHLGDVSIAVRVERNSVSAVVSAESAGVRQWLESQEQSVRNGMAEHGLQLDRFVIQRDGQRREAHPEQEQQQGRRAPRGRQAAATERFEIVV